MNVMLVREDNTRSTCYGVKEVKEKLVSQRGEDMKEIYIFYYDETTPPSYYLEPLETLLTIY